MSVSGSGGKTQNFSYSKLWVEILSGSYCTVEMSDKNVYFALRIPRDQVTYIAPTTSGIKIQFCTEAQLLHTIEHRSNVASQETSTWSGENRAMVKKVVFQR